MIDHDDKLPPAEVLQGLTKGLAIAGGLLILCTAFAVVFSVLGRALVGTIPGIGPVPGDFELVQIGTALCVFAFLPLCQARRGNVIVDTFTLKIGERAQAALDALWDLVYCGFALFIAWRLALGARDLITSNTTSMVLGLPTGYAIAACSAMAVVLAGVAFLTAVTRVRSSR